MYCINQCLLQSMIYMDVYICVCVFVFCSCHSEGGSLHTNLNNHRYFSKHYRNHHKKNIFSFLFGYVVCFLCVFMFASGSSRCGPVLALERRIEKCIYAIFRTNSATSYCINVYFDRCIIYIL